MPIDRQAPTHPGDAPASPVTDLRRAPLADIRALDLRTPERDLWADQAALADRFRVTWAGLDDAAWILPGAAPSDAGGPDWSFQDHVAHVAAWQDLAAQYVTEALDSGLWPSDEDFDGGDFDGYNERLRRAWAAVRAADVRLRFDTGNARLLDLVGRMSAEQIRRDDAWGWIYMTLHGHQLDHLAVLEPWTDQLRQRQADGDPFGPDPAIGTGDETADRRAFWADEARLFAELVRLIDAVPLDRWTEPGDAGSWSLRDHVGHLGSWYVEAVRAIDRHAHDGGWLGNPAEGLDAWNEREVERRRSAPATELRARLAVDREALIETADRLSETDFRSPEGWGWTYENLTGHVRAHLALIAPWCVRVGWPPAPPSATPPAARGSDSEGGDVA